MDEYITNGFRCVLPGIPDAALKKAFMAIVGYLESEEGTADRFMASLPKIFRHAGYEAWPPNAIVGVLARCLIETKRRAAQSPS